MKIVVLAAAERGLKCLMALTETFGPDHEFTVFTFKETAWEPRFVEPIKNFAKQNNIACFVTTKVHQKKFACYLGSNADLIFVVGWRYMLPEQVYSDVRIGCFVFHDSYLPHYRGFSPSVWAIRNGEASTGTTVFKISDRMDGGEILEQRRIKISKDSYISEIVNKITEANVEIIKSFGSELLTGSYKLTKQNDKDATFVCKLIPDDFKISWKTQSGQEIYNLIRAYSTPYPGAYTFLRDVRIHITKAKLVKSKEKWVGKVAGRVKKIHSNGDVTVFTSDVDLQIQEIKINGVIHSPASTITSIGNTLK